MKSVIAGLVAILALAGCVAVPYAPAPAPVGYYYAPPPPPVATFQFGYVYRGGSRGYGRGYRY